MTTLNSGQLLNYEGGAARGTILEQSICKPFHFSYRAGCHAAMSKFSAKKRTSEVVNEWEFPEGW